MTSSQHHEHKRYRVADLDGKRHFFDSRDHAVAFAQRQVDASWTSPSWTVVDRFLDDSSTHSRILVSRSAPKAS